jgi:cell division protein FtsI/penicillin-binding protein 2
MEDLGSAIAVPSVHKGNKLMAPEQDDAARISRRGFFKSFLPQRAENEEVLLPGSFQPTFMWADLRTGQIGFPGGLARNDVMPGSIMHLVAATALLEQRLIDPEEAVVCAQKNLCSTAHGSVDLAHAIAVGCNRYFVHTSRSLTAQSFLQYSSEFGLNSDLGKFASGDFPSNRSGSAGQLLLGIDSNFRPTAVQLLRLAALIASSGKLPALHSAEEAVTGPEPTCPKFADATWQFLRESMHLSCKTGAAAALDPELTLDPAACINTLPFGAQFAATIIGFFPYTKPSYAFYTAAAMISEEDNAIPAAQHYLFAQPWP